MLYFDMDLHSKKRSLLMFYMVITQQKEKRMKTTARSIIKLIIPVMTAVLFFFLFKTTVKAGAIYEWSDMNGATSWYTYDDYDEASNKTAITLTDIPEDLTDSHVIIYAEPTDDVLAFLENIKGTDITVSINAYTYDYVLGKNNNGAVIDTIFYSKRSEGSKLTVNSDVRYITATSDPRASGDIIINGNVETLRLDDPGMRWKKGTGSITINGNLNSIYYLKKSEGSDIAQEEKQYFEGNCTITGTVRKGFVETESLNNGLIEKNSVYEILECSAGVFRITDGVLSSAVPVKEVTEADYYYLYSYEDWGTDSEGNLLYGWTRTKIDKASGSYISYERNASISDITANDSAEVRIPNEEVVIDNDFNYMCLYSGRVVLNGHVNYIQTLPYSSGDYSVVINGGFDVLAIHNNEKNKNINVIVNQDVDNGSYSNSTKNYHYKYFDCPAGTQLIKDGKWNEDIALRLTAEEKENSVYVKNLPNEDEIAVLSGEAQGIGKEITVNANGDSVDIVKRATVDVVQNDVIDDGTRETVKECIETAGNIEDYSIAAVINLDINTWYEESGTDTEYTDGNYDKGKITQLAEGKSLELPFKVEGGTDSDYKVVRIHTEEDGTQTEDIIDSKTLSGDWLSFSTDRFSKFVVVNTGKKKNYIPSDIDKDLAASHCLMYRLYNPNTGEHFYTGSKREGNKLVDVGWNYEGIAWEGPVKSNTPVYRLYNPNVGEHHYTPSKRERDNLIKIGWNDEGIGWYSDDNKRKPLYRLYNPNATTGNHHYTTSTKERDKLVKIGWNDEGIGWYGY